MQEDREDDEELEETKPAEEEEKGQYEQDVRASLTGPIDLQGLRISMPILRDELSDSAAFFEGLLRETYGEGRFRKGL